MMNSKKRSLSAVFPVAGLASLSLLLGACGSLGGSGAVVDPNGQNTPRSCASATAASLGIPEQPSARLGALRSLSVGRPTAPAVPDQIIVRFKPTVAAQSLVTTLNVKGQDLRFERTLGGEPRARVYRTAAASGEQLGALLADLRARADVEYAEVDARVQIQAVPNDTLYKNYQWDLRAICMPAAWDKTTGSGNSVVAVLDTGILYDATNTGKRHPDLAGKMLPGYDFVSKVDMSNDGDGRDNNPFDPGGDESNGSSSYHGTHVAGTIAAATNNGKGVAGVSWGAKILPVRVLGKGGGLISDVADAVYWSIGASVNGVPNNPAPASVLNMSFGVDVSPCPTTLQNAINAAVGRGVVVVAAAGNSGEDASNMTPANCQGVIAVGATTKSGARGSYSNYGSRIDLMAPGGDGTRSGGITNLWGDDTYSSTDSRFYTYAALSGTSMATPHVAGVAALVKEQNPGFTPAQVLARLKSTSTPLTATQCGRDKASDCGAGLIDAGKALGVGSSP